MNRVKLIRSYASIAEDDNQRPSKRQKHSIGTNTFAVLNECGISAFFKGQYKEAQDCFAQAFRSVQIKTSNITETCQTSDSSTNEEYDEGMCAQVSPLPIPESSTLEDARLILNYNLSQTRIRQGHFRDSIVTLNEARAELRKCSEKKNKKTIVRVLHSLGYCYFRLGFNSKAMRCFQDALPLCMGQASTKMCLAATLNCIGVLHFQEITSKSDKAMDALRQSLELYEANKSSSSIEVATVMNNIGRVYFHRKEYTQALEFYQQALKIRTDLLKTDSIDIAATSFNMGQAYHRMGHLDDALEQYSKFLDILSSKSIKRSSDLAMGYRSVGDIHREKAELKLSQEFYRKALLASDSSSKETVQPEIISSLNKLGNLHFEKMDHHSALQCFKEALSIAERSLDIDHPQTIIALTSLAHLYKHQGDYGVALRAYQAALDRQERSLGANSVEVAATYSSIGLVQYHLHDLENAFESYQKALQVRREVYGTDEHLDIASTLNSIGLILFKQESYDIAKECFHKSLNIRTKLLGENHRDTAVLWYNIATIYFETGEENVAVKFYREALRVERHALGDDHPDVAITLQYIGRVLLQQGDLDTAMSHFREALELERTRSGNKASFARILNIMGNIFLQQANVTEMMKCFEEAARIFVSLPSEAAENLVVVGYNFYNLSKLHPPAAPMA